MRNKLTPKTAKIISLGRKKNLPGYSYAFEYQPQDFVEAQHGSLYAVIEIMSSYDTAYEITELILEVIKEEYYSDLTKEPLDSLEDALQRVNEELANVTEQGKAQWLGKLSGIIGILSNKTLHITQSGAAEAYLIRKDKMIHISEGLSETGPPHPLKTFTNIASGDLEKGDKILFTTPAVLFHLSKEELQKYVSEHSPNTAVSKISEVIKGSEENLNRISALVIEATTTETLASETLGEEPEEVFLEESKGLKEKTSETLKPAFSKIGEILSKGAQKVSSFYHETVAPKAKEGKEKVKAKIQESKEARKEIPKETEKKAVATPIKDTQKTASQVGKSVVGIAKKTTESFQKFIRFILSGNKLKIIAVILFALLIGSVIYLGYKQQNEKQIQNYKEIYAQAEDKEKEAENKLIEGDKEKTKQLLSEASDLLEKIINSKYYNYFKEDVDNLKKLISQKLDETEGIVRISPEAIGDLSKKGAKKSILLLPQENSLLSIDEENGSIYELSLSDNSVNQLLESPEGIGKVVSATYSEQIDTIVILTNTPYIYHFDADRKKLSQQKITFGGEWEKGVDIGNYYSNIYILSPEDNQIYKHIKTSTGYTKKYSYANTSNGDLSKAVSLTIDSNIYVLTKENEIYKFTAGNQQNFSVQDLPSPFQDPVKIYTSKDCQNLYVLDKGRNRVVILDKNGVFAKQYVSDNFSNLSGIYVNEASGSMYVLSNNKVYKVNL